MAAVLIAGLGGLYLRGSAGVRAYIDGRLGDLVALVQLDSPEALTFERGLDSTSERVLVAYGASRIIRDNWAFGVGAGRTTEAMESTVGVAKVSHNTLLDLLMVGGIWAVAAILIYLRTLLAGVRAVHAAAPERALVVTLGVVFGAMSLLLTITSSAYWIPFVVALAVAHRGRHTPIATVVEPASGRE